MTHKVGRICVSLQCDVSIRRVTVCKVSGEIPEDTICRNQVSDEFLKVK